MTGLIIGLVGGISAANAAEEAGNAQALAAQQAAIASMQQAQLQADAARMEADLQASEYRRQANIEDARAGIEQIQGEQAAEKRSREAAAAIGALYANYAGNGLLVDGRPTDTLGAALRTQVAEDQSDIQTIRDNTTMNVWTRQQNAASMRSSAANAQITGANKAISYLTAGKNDAQSLLSQGRIAQMQGSAARTSGILSSVGGMLANTPSAINSDFQLAKNFKLID